MERADLILEMMDEQLAIQDALQSKKYPTDFDLKKLERTKAKRALLEEYWKLEGMNAA